MAYAVRLQINRRVIREVVEISLAIGILVALVGGILYTSISRWQRRPAIGWIPVAVLSGVVILWAKWGSRYGVLGIALTALAWAGTWATLAIFGIIPSAPSIALAILGVVGIGYDHYRNR